MSTWIVHQHSQHQACLMILVACPVVQLGEHPFFRSFMERAKVLGNNPVVEKGRNLREDIRERWETAENPTVQKFQV